MKKDFYTVFFGIFAFVGTIMGLIAAFTWFSTNRFTREGVRTTGTVIELVGGRSVAPVVEFATAGGDRRTYTSGLYSSPPAYAIGEAVTLWYDPKNPNEVVLSGLSRWFLPVLLGFFFLIFGGIGYGGLIYQQLKKRDAKWLLENGQPVNALLTNVVLNTSVQLNGSSPFVIQSQWQDPATQKVYVFESDHIWYDPSPYVGDRSIPVLINPHDPRKYYVDLSFLPEAA